ncbi:Glycosyl hydrolase family 115 [Pelagirhabdus alkalitolerans]|uniref:Glycosyl hydrolase family 115 n=1 Tax=Pelagirhabdus alkalitolerans TaxID=1612202 RepID=A0A1G6GNP2_9BACI|nr:glycosyl hydrolase 115 family protein [Pelagirhabdus alkalitolerans]SDB83549.1 Glycosyl hydrolase family 115 [Pelagirhabdus alkalitolerans]
MNFVIKQDDLHKNPLFYQETEAYSGVNKIAEKVMRDVECVFGQAPQKTSDRDALANHVIVYGTLGKSPILDELESQGKLDLSEIRDKREVYQLQVVEAPFDGVKTALFIAGSDKRGTIYGLFQLSEQLGVSPFINWNDVKPPQRVQFSIESMFKKVSKEPSVTYRGFFINDEWPAFGNWAMKRFGGFNAEMYDHVFELLLRLKGNYLWPAMWSARFNDEGPGLKNAELANEYGVVMGASHHEPCLRYGEEYKYLRGENSKYGDAWNFLTNRDGIIKFWEDGLKRSGHFDNVITVGMRGEQDTSIMGKNATLADNIQLLKEVLQTQNQLIQDNVNSNLSEVPRMLALYKEVEPFFYGDENTEGLMGAEELEDVILMLCDDNHGNLRTLPTEEMRQHSGGYGMYYHFDYHGGPISYEWVNSSYLPKIAEQMTMAYDFGVRDLWIVNVGDICTQEFPLSYFLDLAYDFDRFGTDHLNETDHYTKQWAKQQFNHVFSEEELDQVYQLLTGYTKIAHKRRPEHMNDQVYDPVHYQETDRVLRDIEHLLTLAEKLYKQVDPVHFPAYFSLVYYPAVANLNLQKMWLLNTKSQSDAKLGKLSANTLADEVKACLLKDRRLVREYHTINDGQWYGMGFSEHIGFTKWNEDECQNPVLSTVIPANKPRLVVTIDGTDQYSEGSPWHQHILKLSNFLEPDVKTASFTIASLSDAEADYKVTTDASWLTCSETVGTLNGDDMSVVVQVMIDRQHLPKEVTGQVQVETPSGLVTIQVPVNNQSYHDLPEKTFVDTLGYISIEAEHFIDRKNTVSTSGQKQSLDVLKGYGKTLSAVKAFPTTAYFTALEDAPYVEYAFMTKEEATFEMDVYMQPSNPVGRDETIKCAIQINQTPARTIDPLPDGYRVDGLEWEKGVLNHIRVQTVEIDCEKGLNKLRIYPVTPGFVLEKLVMYPKGHQPPKSYLGPTETYYVGR